MKTATINGINSIKNNFREEIKKPIRSGDINKIQELIQKAVKSGADEIDLIDIALSVTLDCREFEIIKYFINRKVEINTQRENELKTSIFEAAELGNLDWFKKLFAKLSQEDKSKLINIKNENEETPLFIVANSENPNQDLIDFLASNGAAREVINKDGQSLSAILEKKIIIINAKNNTEAEDESALTKTQASSPIHIGTSMPIDIVGTGKYSAESAETPQDDGQNNVEDYSSEFDDDIPLAGSGCGLESRTDSDSNELMFPIEYS